MCRDAKTPSCNGEGDRFTVLHCSSLSPRPYFYVGGDDQVTICQMLVLMQGIGKPDLICINVVGIQLAGKHASKARELKLSDLEPREKYWTRFPHEGSKSTLPHQSKDFKWKDYCPMVFRSNALREFSLLEKSGSSFYLTQDDRFMIKTARKSEVKVLIRMLPSYYQHVCNYKNTLVTKFFDLFGDKRFGKAKQGLAKEAAILPMAAYDGVSVLELCLHYFRN